MEVKYFWQNILIFLCKMCNFSLILSLAFMSIVQELDLVKNNVNQSIKKNQATIRLVLKIQSE